MSPTPLVLLFDGHCPICGREAAFLKRLDRKRGNLRVVDISSPNFAAAKYDKTIDQLRARLHAITPEGNFVTGLEAIRRAYAAVGWGFLFVPTRWPILRPLSEWAYGVFSRNRAMLRYWSNPCTQDRCTSRSSRI